nr:putative NADPH-quinone reductase [Niallia circulans]
MGKESDVRLKTLVVAAHPNVQNSRVNKRWLEELRKHDGEITVHELYASYPDKVLDTGLEQRLLGECERLVLQFPLQWYGTPPLLKQWLDEVFTTAWLFGPGGRAVAGKELLLAVSIGGKEETYQAGGLIGYTISELLRPLQAFGNQIGMTTLPHFTFYGANQADDEQIERGAERYIRHVLNPELDPRIARRRMLEEMKLKQEAAR